MISSFSRKSSGFRGWGLENQGDLVLFVWDLWIYYVFSEVEYVSDHRFLMFKY
ncbi:MAG: hypothetical protein RL264_1530 [Bacteroidota bacterium]|jgi:hypothetical protein